MITPDGELIKGQNLLIEENPKVLLWLESLLGNSPVSAFILKPVRNQKGFITDFTCIYANYKASEQFHITHGSKYLESFEGPEYLKLMDTLEEVSSAVKSVERNIGGYLFRISNYNNACLVITDPLPDYSGKLKEDEITRDLMNSKDLLQSILDVSHNPISVWKAIRDNHNLIVNFECILANRTMEERLKRGPLKGQHYFDVYPDAIATGWFDILIEVIEKTPFREIEKNYSLNGIEDWYHVVFQKLEDSVVVNSSRITERKLSEKKIREQSHFIKLVTDSTPDIMYVFDVHQQKTIYINQEVFKTLKFNPEEIYSLGNSILMKLIHPDDYPFALNHYLSLATLKPGEIREIIFRVKDAREQYLWFNFRHTFFKANEQGTTAEVLGIAQNITESKQTEAAFLEEKNRNIELKRINELMDTFVYAAAHDLKAPVSTLKLLSNVIDNTTDVNTKLTLQSRYMPTIEQLEKTIAGLVQVLEVENTSESISKKIEFDSIVKQVTSELADLIREADPDIHTNFFSCESIMYNETYLTSIFRNLLSNALKYRSAERKPCIKIKSRFEGKYIVLSFRDNGLGIDLNNYSNDLFRPFKRLHKNSEGSGIGLHLVKSMVSKNGGKIEVESVVEKGTVFKVYLVQF